MTHAPRTLAATAEETSGHGPGADTDARLRDLVLGYLDDHPTAMDTLDGIAEWWVLRQQIEIEVRRVSRVLATLVADGALEEVEQDGIRFYRRPAERTVHDESAGAT